VGGERHVLRKRTALFATVVAALLGALATPALAADQPASPPADYAIENGHFYSQAAGGQANGGGYSLTDEGGIPMWSEFSRLGGVDQLGYPISGRFLLAGQVVQLTQKAGLVWLPNAGQVRYLNIFGLLHDAGKDPWLAQKGIPPQASRPDEAGKPWDQIAQKRYQLLDLHPNVKSAYFAMYDPVNMYGLPASNWLEQPIASTLRFERVAFQEWKQNVPWAPAGTVQLANGGDLLKESGVLGPLPFAPQPPPPPAPQTVPAGTATVSFYADTFVGRGTSSGQVFRQENLTCASNSFPLGTRLRLTTLDGTRSVVVVNNDRPAAWNARIDLTKAAFSALYPLGSGIGTVKVEIVK
jgi:rare lipoprotein A